MRCPSPFLAQVILGASALTISQNSIAGCMERSVSAGAVRTPQDVKTFVTCAKDYLDQVGEDSAYDAFHNDPRWHSGPIYLFVTELIPDGTKARSLVHAGNPVRETTDPSMLGDRIDEFGTDIIPEGVRIIRVNGGGFWYYGFLNYETGLVAPKVSYILPVNWKGTPAMLGAGIYLRDLPATCRSDEVSASILAADPSEGTLREFVRCAAFELESEGYFATHAFETDARWTSGSIYLFGLDLSGNQVFTGSRVRTNGVSFAEWPTIGGPRDQFGGRDIPGIGDTFGEAFIYYRAFNPLTGRSGRKVGFLKRVVVVGVPVLLGAGYYLD